MSLKIKRCSSYKGNYSEFLVKKAAEQKAIEEKYENDMKEIERLEGIIAQQRQWNREKNIKTAESKEKIVEKIKAQLVIPDKKLEKIRFDFTPKCVSGEDVLEVDGLRNLLGSILFFKTQALMLKGENEFSFWADNGCGKTTSFKILMGDLSRDDGTFKFGAVL